MRGRSRGAGSEPSCGVGAVVRGRSRCAGSEPSCGVGAVPLESSGYNLQPLRWTLFDWIKE